MHDYMTGYLEKIGYDKQQEASTHEMCCYTLRFDPVEGEWTTPDDVTEKMTLQMATKLVELIRGSEMTKEKNNYRFVCDINL